MMYLDQNECLDVVEQPQAVGTSRCSLFDDLFISKHSLLRDYYISTISGVTHEPSIQVSDFHIIFIIYKNNMEVPDNETDEIRFI